MIYLAPRSVHIYGLEGGTLPASASLILTSHGLSTHSSGIFTSCTMASTSSTQALLDARSKAYGAAFEALDVEAVLSWHSEFTVFNDIGASLRCVLAMSCS